MNLKRTAFFLLLSIFALSTYGPEISFKDTVRNYDRARILINARGALVRGGWGIANIATGGVGYFAAKDDQWKYFHEMNAASGIVNAGIASLGYLRAMHQARQKFVMQDAYSNYRKDKRTQIVYVGADVVVMGAGAALVNYSKTDKTNPALTKGFGNSLLLQGIVLLAYDNLMLAIHQRYNGRWVRIMDEMRVTGTGVSIKL